MVRARNKYLYSQSIDFLPCEIGSWEFRERLLVIASTPLAALMLRHTLSCRHLCLLVIDSSFFHEDHRLSLEDA